MKFLKYALSSFALCLSLNTFADIPKEKVELNPSADLKAPSISVQGLGNKILDELTSAKYLAFEIDGVEYAYTFKRLGSADVRYTGNPGDIAGLVFLEVTAYQDGLKLNSQLTTYRPSKYKNAIKLEKFDRNEKRPYQFDVGMDSKGRVFGIDSLNEVTYLYKKDSIKQPKDPKEDNPLFF